MLMAYIKLAIWGKLLLSSQIEKDVLKMHRKTAQNLAKRGQVWTPGTQAMRDDTLQLYYRFIPNNFNFEWLKNGGHIEPNKKDIKECLRAPFAVHSSCVDNGWVQNKKPGLISINSTFAWYV